jgi:hypothetical protein
MDTYRWIADIGTGIEHLAVWEEGGGIAAQAVVIGDDEGSPYGAAYRIACDAAWRVRQAVVEVAGGGRRVLVSDGAGRWHDGDGQPLALLDGCIDIDITATPFTNTLPIRRLGAALAQRRTIEVAWVHVPELRVERAVQAYTRLGANRYRFESVGGDFEAELEVDDKGFVVRYPGLFRRI